MNRAEKEHYPEYHRQQMARAERTVIGEEFISIVRDYNDFQEQIKNNGATVVGGNIEPFYPYEEAVCLVCDDEGKISGKALNRAVYDDKGKIMDIMAGTFFICDCSGESFGSLSNEQLERYGKKFYYPENFFRINDEIKALKYKPEKMAEAR